MEECFEQMAVEVEASVDAGTYSFEECATRIEPLGPYYAQDVVAALYSSIGSIADAARLLGRNRQRLRDYIDRNPDVLDYCADLTGKTLDQVERVVFASAIAGNIPAAKYVLSTKGKDRGWTMRHELTGKDGDPIQHELSPRERVIARLEAMQLEEDAS